MQYLGIGEARERPELRLVLSVGVPGPWGEGIKHVLRYKGLHFVSVEQRPSEANHELAAWTGRRNAPVMVTAEGEVIDRWLDMTMLAERLRPDPPALPAAAAERVLAIGLLHELAGENGFGWNRRLLTMRALNVLPAADAPPVEPHWRQIFRDYGVTPAALARAPERIVAILRMLSERLHAQRAAGSPVLVGTAIGAVDIYWAVFSQMLRPLPHAVCAMPEAVRQAYTITDPEIVAAIDPILFEHRDRMFEQVIGLPLDF